MGSVGSREGRLVDALVVMAFRRGRRPGGGSPTALCAEPALRSALKAVREGKVDPDALAEEAGSAFEALGADGHVGAARELLDALVELAEHGPVPALAVTPLLRAEQAERDDRPPALIAADAQLCLRLTEALPDRPDLRVDAATLLASAAARWGRRRLTLDAWWTAYDGSPVGSRDQVATRLAEHYAWLEDLEARQPAADAATEVADGERLLRLVELRDPHLRGDVERRMATVLRELGQEKRAQEILERVFAAATDPSLRMAVAADLASAHAEADRPVEAADWAWRVGECLEASGAPHDPADLAEVVAMQYAAVQAQRAQGRPARESRRIWERVLTRPTWWPADASVCEVHGYAAQLAVLDNDPAAAHRHLQVATSDTAGRSPETQAELNLTEGELACLETDLASLERAVRMAGPYLSSHGSAEQRQRLTILVQVLDQIRGFQPLGGGPATAQSGGLWAAVTDVYREVLGGRIDSASVDARLWPVIAHADPLDQGHLIVTAHTFRAAVLAAEQRIDQARTAIGLARQALAHLREQATGGFPQAIIGQVEAAAILVDLADAFDEQTVSRMDRLWQQTLVQGPRAAVASYAGVAAAGWLHLGEPWRALPAAVAAVSTAADLTHGPIDSHDRAARRRHVGQVLHLALRAAAGTGDPGVLAEMLEVIRAQGMPVATRAEPGWAGPFAALLAALQSTLPAVGTDADPIAVRLPVTPLIVMPWGSVALARWSVPDPAETRGRATLTIGASGID